MEKEIKGASVTKPKCPKNHRFRPISFNEKTGEAVYACKCGIKWPRKAKFMCYEPKGDWK